MAHLRPYRDNRSRDRDLIRDVIGVQASDCPTNERLFALVNGSILANPSLFGTGGVGVVHRGGG